jgi:hypothetical protein
MIHSHADPAVIPRHIIDAEGIHRTQFLVLEVFGPNLHRATLGLPFLAWVLKIPDVFLLFGVHRDHRLVPALERLHLCIDMLELGIPIGVMGSFPGLAVALKTLAEVMEQGSDRTVRQRIALPTQLLRQVACTFAGPAEWGLRITPGQGIHQRLQRREQGGVPIDQSVAATAGTADAIHRFGLGRFIFQDQLVMFLEFSDPGPDRGAAQTRGLGHSGQATIGKSQGFARSPPTPHPFVHDGLKPLIFLADGLNDT